MTTVALFNPIAFQREVDRLKVLASPGWVIIIKVERRIR